MSNPTVFDVQKGDVVLTASVLQRIRNGTLTLSLLGETGEVKFDKPTADAIVSGAKSIRIFHSSYGHRALDSSVLNKLT